MVSTPFHLGHGRHSGQPTATGVTSTQDNARSNHHQPSVSSTSAQNTTTTTATSILNGAVHDAEELFTRALRWCRRRKLPHRPSDLLRRAMLPSVTLTDETQEKNTHSPSHTTHAANTADTSTTSPTLLSAQQRQVQERRILQTRLVEQLITTACRAQKWYSTVCDEVKCNTSHSASHAYNGMSSEERQLPALLHYCCRGHPGRKTWLECWRRGQHIAASQWTSTHTATTRSEYLFRLGQSIVRGVLITFPHSLAAGAELFDVVDRAQYAAAVSAEVSRITERIGLELDTPLATLPACRDGPNKSSAQPSSTSSSSNDGNDMHNRSPRRAKGTSCVSFVTTHDSYSASSHDYACIDALNVNGACVVQCVLCALAETLHPALFSGILVGLMTYGVHTWKRPTPSSLTSNEKKNISNGLQSEMEKAAHSEIHSTDAHVETGKGELLQLPSLLLPKHGDATECTVLQSKSHSNSVKSRTPRLHRPQEGIVEEEGRTTDTLRNDVSPTSRAHSQSDTHASSKRTHSSGARGTSGRYGSMQSRKRRGRHAAARTKRTTTLDGACWVLHNVLLILLLRVQRMQEALLSLSPSEAKGATHTTTTTSTNTSAAGAQSKAEGNNEIQHTTHALTTKGHIKRNKQPTIPLDLQAMLTSYQSSMSHNLDANCGLDKTHTHNHHTTTENTTNDETEKSTTAQKTDFAQLLVNVRSVLSMLSFFAREEPVVQGGLPAYAEAFTSRINTTVQAHAQDTPAANINYIVALPSPSSSSSKSASTTLLSLTSALSPPRTPHVPSTTSPRRGFTGAAVHTPQGNAQPALQPQPTSNGTNISDGHRGSCNGEHEATDVLLSHSHEVKDCRESRSECKSGSTTIVKSDPPYTIQHLYALCGLHGWTEPLCPPLLTSVILPHLVSLFDILSHFHTQWRLIDNTENQIALKMNLLFAFDIPTLLALRTVARVANELAPLRVAMGKLAEEKMVLYKVMDVLDCQLLQSQKLYLNTDTTHWLQLSSSASSSMRRSLYSYCPTLEDDEEKVLWEQITQCNREGWQSVTVTDAAVETARRTAMTLYHGQASTSGTHVNSFTDTHSKHTTILTVSKKEGQSKSALTKHNASKGGHQAPSDYTSSSLPNLTDTIAPETSSRHVNSEGSSGTSVKAAAPSHTQPSTLLTLCTCVHVSNTSRRSSPSTTAANTPRKASEQARIHSASDNTQTSHHNSSGESSVKGDMHNGVAVQYCSALPSLPTQQQQPTQIPQPPQTARSPSSSSSIQSLSRPFVTAARMRSLQSNQAVHVLHSAPISYDNASHTTTTTSASNREVQTAMLPPTSSYLIPVSRNNATTHYSSNKPCEDELGTFLASHVVRDPPMLIAANRLTMDTELDERAILDTFDRNNNTHLATVSEIIADASSVHSSLTSSVATTSTSSSSSTASLTSTSSLSQHHQHIHKRRHHGRRQQRKLLTEAANTLQSSSKKNNKTLDEILQGLNIINSNMPHCTGYVGLLNMGNTCFMNSVVQLLFQADRFMQDVLQRRFMPLAATCYDESEVSDTSPNASHAATSEAQGDKHTHNNNHTTSLDGTTNESSNTVTDTPVGVAQNVTEVALYLLFSEMYWRIHHSPAYDAWYIRPHFFTTYVPPPFNDGRQHDASEFAKVLLTILDEEETKSRNAILHEANNTHNNNNDTAAHTTTTTTATSSNANEEVVQPTNAIMPTIPHEPTIVHRWFGGTLATTMECLTCHSLRTRTSEFWDVTIPILSDRALEELDTYNNTYIGGVVEGENSNKNGFILIGSPTPGDAENTLSSEAHKAAGQKDTTTTILVSARPLRTLYIEPKDNNNSHNSDKDDGRSHHDSNHHEEEEEDTSQVNNKRHRLTSSPHTTTNPTTLLAGSQAVEDANNANNSFSEYDYEGVAGIRQDEQHMSTSWTDVSSKSNKASRHLYGVDNNEVTSRRHVSSSGHAQHIQHAATTIGTNNNNNNSTGSVSKSHNPHHTPSQQQHHLQPQGTVRGVGGQAHRLHHTHSSKNKKRKHHYTSTSKSHGSPRSVVERRQSATIQVETVYAKVPSSSSSSSSSSSTSSVMRTRRRGVVAEGDEENMMSAHTPQDNYYNNDDSRGRGVYNYEFISSPTTTPSSLASSPSSLWSSAASLLGAPQDVEAKSTTKLAVKSNSSSSSRKHVLQFTGKEKVSGKADVRGGQVPVMKMLTWHNHKSKSHNNEEERLTVLANSSDAIHSLRQGHTKGKHYNVEGEEEEGEMSGSLLVSAHTAPALLPGTEGPSLPHTSPPHEVFSLQTLLDKALDPQCSSEVLDEESRLECERCGRRTVTELRTMVLSSSHTTTHHSSRNTNTDNHHTGLVEGDDAFQGSSDLPYYLTIQLNRFRYNRHTQSREKITHGVRLEQILSLPVMSTRDIPLSDEWSDLPGESTTTTTTGMECTRSSAQQEESTLRHASEQGAAVSEERRAQWWRRTRRVQYALRAIIIHSGSTPDSGHYFTLVRRPLSTTTDTIPTHNTTNSDIEEDEATGWVTLNDSVVQPVEASAMRAVLQGSGGVFGALETPYILLYERINRNTTVSQANTCEAANVPALHFPPIIERTFAENLAKMTSEQVGQSAQQSTGTSTTAATVIGPMPQCSAEPGAQCTTMNNVADGNTERKQNEEKLLLLTYQPSTGEA